MMAISTDKSGRSVPLEQIRVPDNVRELDPEHVRALAGSIALQGLLVPVVVRATDDGFELVAGFHRVAAARSLDLAEVPVVLREAETEDADRAVENITRKQLNPYEEARAVAAMLARGLSADGAAQALGWSKARVTARIKILELPERAQQLIGAGAIALSAVDQLRAIGSVAPELLEAVIAYLDDGNEWAAERLGREPGWVLDAALRHGDTKAFAAYLDRLDSYAIAELKLGKKTDALLERATKLHRQLDRYAYGPPQMRFSEADVDQARATGVVIEFDRGRPIIVDRGVYRELAKAAIKRTLEELEAKVTAAAAEKQTRRAGKAPADPVTQAKRERDRALRELADQAHGANLDLGAALLTGLATVDPGDMDVARFFVYALLGSDYDDSPYTQTGERVQRLALAGVRLVIEEFRSDVTKTRKDGSRGRLRVSYGDPKDAQAAVKWLWKFVDAAKTPGELYGRALVVIAAEQHAARLMLPTSQRSQPTRWGSHKDLAAKALRKLAGPHVPASLSKLEQAVKRAQSAHAKAERAHHEAQRAARENTAAAAPPVSESEEPLGEDVVDELTDTDTEQGEDGE
jgi:ParB/RepB/Spo0J family partition protein